MKRILFFVATLISISSLAQPRVTQEHKDRAAAIVAQMTLDEKIDYVGGFEHWYIRAIDRLGLEESDKFHIHA